MKAYSKAHVKLHYLTRLFPARSELHLLRKLWHMTTGCIIVCAYMAGLEILLIQCLGAFLALALTMEVMRLRNPLLNERCIRWFSPIIRSNEVNKISGMPYFVASCIVAIAVFPKPIAILSMLYLALADPISSLVGILYSSRSVKIFDGKSLHGTAAGFIICMLITWLYLRTEAKQGLDLIRLSLLGGFAGAIAELLPLELDDNFTIPIVSGFILWLGFLAVQFF